MKNISIIIPAYNSQKKISVTIDSLLSQNDLEFEIVIVDDGSTDQTYKIVKKMLEKSKFENYKIVQQKNTGVSVARNRGIEESTNEYVYFLDADDYVSNNMIEVLNKKINKSDSEIFTWGYNQVKEDGTILSNYAGSPSFFSREMSGIDSLKENLIDNTLTIWTGSAIYKKSLLIENNLKFTPNCETGEDLEFIGKSLVNASSVIFIDKVLSFYVRTEGSVTMSYNIRKLDAVFAMERLADYLRETIKYDAYNLADYVEQNSMPVHYRLNFMSSYEHFDVNRSVLNIRRIKCFKNEIKSNYPEHPNLDKEMRIKLIKVKDKNLKNFLINKVFAISPLIFMNLFELKNKFKE